MPLFKPSRSTLAISVVVLLIIAVVAGLAWTFGRQLALARQMRAEEAWLEQKVASEKARYDDLVAQLAYVRSDEYVEQWAREDAVLARGGETVVVLVMDDDDSSLLETSVVVTPEPESEPFWVELWDLFFGPTATP